ncbi:MAG: hypothetical protein WBP89_15895 [Sedimenticolaceae bacterium]
METKVCVTAAIPRVSGNHHLPGNAAQPEQTKNGAPKKKGGDHPPVFCSWIEKAISS